MSTACEHDWQADTFYVDTCRKCGASESILTPGHFSDDTVFAFPAHTDNTVGFHGKGLLHSNEVTRCVCGTRLTAVSHTDSNGTRSHEVCYNLMCSEK